MSARALTAIGVFFVLIGAASLSVIPTEATRAQGTGDRYLVTEIENGIMRVDRKTGEVSVCREHGGKWNCTLVSDDRYVLEREINDLERENRQLRHSDRYQRKARRDRRDDRHRNKVYDDMEDNSQGAHDDLGKDEGFMSPAEIDKAMDTFEHMLNRFTETARQLRNRMSQGDKPAGN